MLNDIKKTELTENEVENVAGGAAYGDNYYIVKRGDTLSAIAVKHHTTVNKLLALNPYIANANLIYPGDIIRLY